MAAQSDRIQTALSCARQNLRSELSVEELAAAAHLSVRQFSRAFRQETSQSPAKAVEALRAEAARVMLEEGSHSVEELADATGFGNRERMRRAFVRVFGRPPQELRREGGDDSGSARRSSLNERGENVTRRTAPTVREWSGAFYRLTCCHRCALRGVLD